METKKWYASTERKNRQQKLPLRDSDVRVNKGQGMFYKYVQGTKGNHTPRITDHVSSNRAYQ